MDGNQENLIYHFIKYYKSLNIPTSNWKIILHQKSSCENSKSILNNEGINYEIIKDWNSDLKTSKVNEFIKTIDCGWLIYADLDEFFDYEENLYTLIDKCENMNIEFIKGIFIEKFAENFELKPITKESNIFSTFNTDPTEQLKKIINEHQNITKIMLIKITKIKKPQYYNTHRIIDLEKYKQYDKLFKINHFRWSYYAKQCIRNKLTTYINKNEKDKIEHYNMLYFLIKMVDNRYYIELDDKYL